MSETAPKLTLSVQAGLLGFCSEFQSTEETRHYLNGVFVELCPAGGVIGVATDGHTMLCIYDADGRISEPAIIKVPEFFLTMLRKKPDETVTSEDTLEPGAEPTLCSDIMSVRCEIIDGSFPDWRKVVPSVSEAIETGAFQTKLLNRFEAVSKWAGNGLGAMRLYAASASEPTLVKFRTPLSFGIIMPVRVDADECTYSIPSWVNVAEKDAA